MYRVLDLFSGIGGFSLGLERTGGFQTVAFCEIEPFPRQVLAKHWPGVPCYEDIRDLTADRLAADGIAPDVICGGFPCQDISTAGKGAGLAGERSGLWREYARLVGEIRPEFVIVENVAALLGRGLGDVLGDLAALGYDAEWHCIPAAAVGAPHRRDRVWIIAHANSPTDGQQHLDAKARRNGDRANTELADAEGVRRDVVAAPQPGINQEKRQRQAGGCDGAADMANAPRERCREARGFRREQSEERTAGCGEAGGSVPDAAGDGRREGDRTFAGTAGGWSEAGRFAGACEGVADANSAGRIEQWRGLAIRPEQFAAECGGWWGVEPDVGRVAHGVRSRVDRLRGLGNAVVPQIPELIGRAILASAGAISEAAE